MSTNERNVALGLLQEMKFVERNHRIWLEHPEKLMVVSSIEKAYEENRKKKDYPLTGHGSRDFFVVALGVHLFNAFQIMKKKNLAFSSLMVTDVCVQMKTILAIKANKAHEKAL